MKKAFKSIKTLFLAVALSVIPGVTLTSCSSDDEPRKETSLSEEYSGTYPGTITLDVAGQYFYDAEIKCVISEGADNTINVTFPEYYLSATMMGDLTLGSVTISGLEYDETRGGFWRDYGSVGLIPH